MKRIPRYSIELVKESNRAYECDQFAANPKEMGRIFDEIFNLSKACEEKMVMACLDAKCKIIGTFEVSTGTLTSSMVHPREIFKRALLLNAYSIAIAHNHPSSGDTTPSTEDIKITKRLKDAGELLGVSLLDHIIIGDDYCSLKERGYI